MLNKKQILINFNQKKIENLYFTVFIFLKKATGYGLVYFTEDMLNNIGNTIKGKNVAISGSGNVA